MQARRLMLVGIAIGTYLGIFTTPLCGQPYDVDLGNLEATVEDIYANNQEALDVGIGKDSLTSFLQRLLLEAPVNPSCITPEVVIDDITSANILFNWPKELSALTYSMDCLNFTTGASGNMQINNPPISTNRDNQAVCLYAFSSWCDQSEKSIVRVIIVDKDIVANGDEFDDNNIPLDFNIPRPIPRFLFVPNPFEEALYFDIILYKKSNVKLHLLNGVTGVRQGELLIDQEFTTGHHQWPIALPPLAAGIYLGVLEVNGRRSVIPLVKAN